MNMDENKLPNQQSDDQWLDELLATPDLGSEIGADEQAIAAAGLTHPDDLELEKIMQEVLSEVRAEEDVLAQTTVIDPVQPPAPQPEPETFKDDEFRAAFGEGESLNQVFSNAPMPTPPEPQPEPAPVEENEEDEPVEKGRPKRKKGDGLFGLPHLAATAIWLMIIVAIGVSVGRLVWLCASDVLAFGRKPITATVTIEEGDDIPTIAKKLKDAGLIEYTGLFEFYAGITEAQEKIKPGTYQFNAVTEDNETIVYDYMALVTVMSPRGNGLVIVDDLRIPEGYTCAQIFQLLEDKKVCTVAELEEYAANGELDEYWFLEGVVRGDKYCLEGYLFPDTYDFYENDDPERVLEKMLDAFNASFTEVMRNKLAKLEGYTIRDVIIIASMIEKETANIPESFTISSVIYNRLNNSSEFPFLNIDATIVYALGGKSDLTEEDLKIDSPYNTYTNKGLPPGPISNPSQNSIAAALDPEETLDENGKRIKYYYYALDPSTNEHHFSKTYKEHQAFLDSLKEAE
jgi:UPF0755 protein